MVGESGIKANSAQFSWSLAELGKKKMFLTSSLNDVRNILYLALNICWGASLVVQIEKIMLQNILRVINAYPSSFDELTF